MRKLIPLLCLLALPCLAQQVSLKWDASPSAVTNYLLLVHTNAPTASNALATASLKLGTGTATQAVLSEMKPATYWFSVVAQSSQGVYSDLSNILQVDVPKPAANLRTVVIQYTVGVTDPGTNVGMFRFTVLPSSGPPAPPGP